MQTWYSFNWRITNLTCHTKCAFKVHFFSCSFLDYSIRTDMTSSTSCVYIPFCSNWKIRGSKKIKTHRKKKCPHTESVGEYFLHRVTSNELFFPISWHRHDWKRKISNIVNITMFFFAWVTYYHDKNII
jgi:hypothetical protein